MHSRLQVVLDCYKTELKFFVFELPTIRSVDDIALNLSLRKSKREYRALYHILIDNALIRLD